MRLQGDVDRACRAQVLGLASARSRARRAPLYAAAVVSIAVLGFDAGEPRAGSVSALLAIDDDAAVLSEVTAPLASMPGASSSPSPVPGVAHDPITLAIAASSHTVSLDEMYTPLVLPEPFWRNPVSYLASSRPASRQGVASQDRPAHVVRAPVANANATDANATVAQPASAKPQRRLFDPVRLAALRPATNGSSAKAAADEWSAGPAPTATAPAGPEGAAIAQPDSGAGAAAKAASRFAAVAEPDAAPGEDGAATITSDRTGSVRGDKVATATSSGAGRGGDIIGDKAKRRPGGEKAGGEKAGVDKGGVEKGGVDKAGSDKAGSDKAGSDKAGTVALAAGARAGAGAGDGDDDAVAAASGGAIVSKLSREQRNIARFIAKRYRVELQHTKEIVYHAYHAAREFGVDPLLVLAIVSVESSFNASAQSPKGAQGLMQVHTRVHRDKFEPYGGVRAAFDPRVNLRVGTRILREYIQRGGDIVTGLKFYVGAALLEHDFGYARKVFAARSRIAAAAVDGQERSGPAQAAAEVDTVEGIRAASS